MKSFAISRTETTTAHYARCVAAHACTPAAKDEGCNSGELTTKANHPINCVTFDQAQRHCKWQGMRLPTEAEWQLAAGGPSGTPFPWGFEPASNMWTGEPRDSYPPGAARYNLCWMGDDTDVGHAYPTSTCAVGSFSAGNTPSGVSDMAGNVWEWTTGEQKLPGGDKMRRIKGGGYIYDPMGRLRVGVADNDIREDTEQASDLGFRCVK